MEIQVYDEACLTSMLKVRCENNETGLGLRLGFWKAVDEPYCYVYMYGPSLMLVGLCSSFSGLE